MYFSFTTTLLKTDMQGNLLGSVEGMTGHLGCMTLNPDDGRLYASIEYKHDAIGKGILNKLEGVRNDEQTGFYVAVFDVDRIDRIGMNAEKDDVMKTVYIKEAVDDYYAKVSNNGQELEHRFGCSGIDGVTFAPAFGQSRDGKKYLYVAYGIYGDTLRIGIAGAGDEHIEILARVTSALEDEEVLRRLKTTDDPRYILEKLAI